MNMVWLAIIIVGIVSSGSIMFFYQSAISEVQSELLLSESVALSDQITTQQRLSVMLSESVGISDKVTFTILP